MSLYDRNLILFSGKGGVGKTTIASSYALSCARRGQRTLLMELNVRDKVASYFGSQEVGSEIVTVEDNLHAVNVTPDAAMEEYGMMILRMKLVYRAVFENRVVRTFLQAIPGLNDLLMIGKAWHHATETDADGGPVWDTVVVDAPATGHGIFLLQIPSVIMSSISSGHMYREAEKIFSFLTDPQKTALNLVTLAEDMPVNETKMLRDQARQKLEMPIGCVVANGLYPQTFDERERDWIDAAHEGNLSDARGDSDRRDAGLTGMINAAAFHQQRIDMQRHYMDEIERSFDAPIARVPFYFEDRITFPVIESIAEHLADQLDPEGAP